MSDFIPYVKNVYKMEKKGYNYRICCLHSLAAVIPHLSKPQIQEVVIPIFVEAMKDDIPNVRFSVTKVILKNA